MSRRTTIAALGQQGFTLIELLIIVAIIGVLAAIALPAFASYRDSAFDALAASDLRNVMVAEEAYYVEHQEYTPAIGDLVGVLISQGVQFALATPTPTSWNGAFWHPAGTMTVCFDSAGAGLEQFDGPDGACS